MIDIEAIKAKMDTRDYLGHARVAVPALVAEVERLRAENEMLVDAYDRLKVDADAVVGRLKEKYRVDL